MRPASTGLTVLLAGLTAISLSAQNQPPAQAQRAATIRTEMVNGREAAAGEVLLKLRGGNPAADLRAIGALADAGAIDPIGRAGVRRLRSRSMNARALVARLAGHPAVEYVEPNYILHALADSNDPSFPQLWGLKNVGQAVNGGPAGLAGADVHASAAWNYAIGSQAHVVAIVDTGIDYTHPDLAANMWSAPAAFTVTIGGVPITCPAGTHGFNAIAMTCNPMDDHNHGTHVSGTIGASGNNALGVVGINWITQLMGIKFLDSNGSGTVDAAINGIDFAIQARAAFAPSGGADVRVLSASWGGTDFSQALLDEILAANDHDMLFVAAAGNNGISNDILPTYPASYTAPNIVSVAATTNTDTRAYFSNYSATSVHLGAPGVDILSTTIGGNYAFFSGTSMATPHVSGAAALLLSVCPMDTAGVKNVLLSTVDPVADLATTTVSGGRLDLYSAIRSCVALPDPATNLVAAPGDARLTLTWAGAAGATGFNVKRSLTPGGPYAPIATTVKGRTYADTTVVNGTPYYYVVSGVNGFGEGADSNEAFATPNAPSDLVVANLTAPGAGGAGLPMVIASTTTNRGPGAAASSSTRFYLSADPTPDVTDRVLGTQAVPALTAGASFSGSSTFTVPPDTPAGLYYLFGTADADNAVNETSDSNNNSALRQVFIGPDLVVTSLTVPAAAGAGADLLVTDTVNNRGGGTAARSTTRFYLSTDVLLSANDVPISGGLPVSELAPAASESGSATVTLPVVPAGTYFVIAVADGDNTVGESIESNNSSLVRAIRIGGDLAVTALTVPATAGGGDTIQVTDTTTNQAAGAMGAPSVTRFYLSTKSTFDSSATLLTGGHAVPDLAAGASSTATTSVTLPSPLPVATYYLLAVADGDNAVTEISETNNTAARAILVGGDLSVSALTVPAGGGSGATIGVSDTTTNQGGGGVPGSITRFYLSKDALLDATDVALDGSRVVPALAAGASSAGTTSVRIPDAVTAGAYFLIAKADADGSVAESSETNNVASRPISIGPDLVVSSLTTASVATAGTTITVTDVVTNLGGGTAGPSVTRYYLSVNGSVNGARVLDGSRSIDSLAAGASSAGSVVLTIPADIPLSALYLVAKTDADGAVSEGAESNNTRERVILILPR